MTQILIVDDDQAMCRLLKRLLQKAGMDVVCKSDPHEAVDVLSRQEFDLVLSDFYMPQLTGEDILHHVKNLQPATDVIIMTAFASIEHAVNAMRSGAYDYIVKPFQNDDVLHAVGRVLEKRRLERENTLLRSQLVRTSSFHHMVGKSVAMERLFTLIQKVSQSDATVNLQGESGTGKELVARAIHQCGPRSSKPFVAVNCSALPDTLLESELFGHARGAFTGAAEARQGLFQHADGGTLFLDEIADTSPAVQAKLLRVLQEKKVRRLGDNMEKGVDVRVITATSRDLNHLMEQEAFREDLFYRINVFPIAVPPLRERREDIPMLAEHFLQGRKRLETRTMDILCAYHWPGNIRELENLMERLCVFIEAEHIFPDDLPAEIHGFSRLPMDTQLPYNEAKEQALREFHHEYLGSILSRAGGNITQAARTLNLDRANLQRLLRRYTIDPDTYRS
ncbi:sigma-54 factor interaction domain-containing protein [Desulfurispirillum indicum S5]|uniref:Sigma-54 factor interaction domain-containing protein n=1 Tax=Desulfurispirillum indicum (strain ATCC BAA-1389 / DSM 22839 / S5) TaxID=653733 RepID=E6W4Q3_DESIS|nr:sigma-54 dependent transcriptional regulator [Desulfurispirillum indicum]ADU64781.1 sigma-54 factor interaction domain-containing protein [Desulfurispirillum indicum S5]